MLSLLAVLCYALHDMEKGRAVFWTNRPVSWILWTESLRVEVQAVSSH